jgi:hypothetical protein
MDELTNPFRPGAGTSPPALLGRDELIKGFGTTVRRAIAGKPGRSLMPIGFAASARRYFGKTVFRQDGIAEPVRRDRRAGGACGRLHRSAGVRRLALAARVRKILLDYDNKKKIAKVLEALRVLKTFALQLPDGSRVSLDVDAIAGSADSGNLSDDVTDLLVAAGEAAAERDGC